jgi:hypothetical protein
MRPENLFQSNGIPFLDVYQKVADKRSIQRRRQFLLTSEMSLSAIKSRVLIVTGGLKALAFARAITSSNYRFEHKIRNLDGKNGLIMRE